MLGSRKTRLPAVSLPQWKVPAFDLVVTPVMVCLFNLNRAISPCYLCNGKLNQPRIFVSLLPDSCDLCCKGLVIMIWWREGVIRHPAYLATIVSSSCQPYYSIWITCYLCIQIKCQSCIAWDFVWIQTSVKSIHVIMVKLFCLWVRLHAANRYWWICM